MWHKILYILNNKHLILYGFCIKRMHYYYYDDVLWKQRILQIRDLEIYLYHGPVGTTELVLYREVKCIASFIQSVL